MKQLTVFAGPNGSGKTTITREFQDAPPFELGYYLNPDEIEEQLRTYDTLVFSNFSIAPTQSQWDDFLVESTLAAKICREAEITLSQLAEGFILWKADGYMDTRSSVSDAYIAALLTDFIRQMLIVNGLSFTFETVMSSADKIDTLRKAKVAGYYIRFFYVTTRDPDINVSRVQNRRAKGGHLVPEQKIRERYWRSLENLAAALLLADEAYLYDNSADGSRSLEIAQLKDGILTVTADAVPPWYIQFVEKKLA